MNNGGGQFPIKEDGRRRVENHAAPISTKRCGKSTPCADGGICVECDSPERICNTWTIVEESLPQGRIRVVFINEDLGSWIWPGDLVAL